MSKIFLELIVLSDKNSKSVENFKIKLNDFGNNDKKKSFSELSDKLLNKIWSVHKYRIVFCFCFFFFCFVFFFFLVGVYGISTIGSYLMQNPLYTYILNINDLFCFVFLVLWHINYCRLFNAKSSLYLYMKYIWFCLFGFYDISTIVDYLMPNPLYTYILNI